MLLLDRGKGAVEVDDEGGRRGGVEPQIDHSDFEVPLESEVQVWPLTVWRMVPKSPTE